MKKYALILGCALLASPVYAAKNINIEDNLYFGGGIGINDADDDFGDASFGGGYDDATGFQVFAGYDLDYRLGKASLAAEVGYMDSGDFEQDVDVVIPGFGRIGGRTIEENVDGLWTTGVISLPVGAVNLIGRAGLDFGDDDGFMVGGGVGIDLSREWELRFEYVMRDNVDSLQANIAFSL
jgi:opacity protein-like surface antigen